VSPRAAGLLSPSMHLVKIDVIGLQPSETALHFAHDVHAGRAASVEISLIGSRTLVARTISSLTDKNLALPEAVHVRCVDKVNSPVQG
jgi:hypothetical protein